MYQKKDNISNWSNFNSTGFSFDKNNSKSIIPSYNDSAFLESIPDDAFGEGGAAEDTADQQDIFNDPHYKPPAKQYIDVLKEFFGHSKFRP